jgi:hypothetical protein
MKIKTSDLTGTALDWAVGYIMGEKLRILDRQIVWPEDYSPSTDWAQGGPIIDREDIAMSSKPDGLWAAYAPQGTKAVTHAGQTVEVYNWTYKQCGYTPLIAAMRCYVASKLGDTIEIPEELK